MTLLRYGPKGQERERQLPGSFVGPPTCCRSFFQSHQEKAGLNHSIALHGKRSKFHDRRRMR
jgi:hypothetical protein